MDSFESDSSADLGRDAGELGEVWRTFARRYAATRASPALERRVLAAWEARQISKRRHQPRRVRLLWAVGAIAGALVMAPPVIRDVDEPPRSPQPARNVRAAVAFAVDPALETETLQLVRVRMPRAALQAAGVAVSGPGVDGFVEVDVVIGEDGLPRDIRRVALIRP